MSDQDFIIEIEEDTEGHRYVGGVVEPKDAEWLQEKLQPDHGTARVRVTLSDDDDTEGHGPGGDTLTVILSDEDDVEGHAIAIHFPSRADADAFRKRLLLTGVLVGTVALGAAGGIGLSALQSDSGTGAASSAVTQTGPMDAHEAPAFDAGARADQAWSDRLTGAGAAAQVQPMDAHEAPAFQGTGGLSQADQAYADRLSAQAAAQAGPMDAHEAPAFQNAAGAVDADRDLGIMDASGAQDRGAPSYVDAARQEALANQNAASSTTDADRDLGIMDRSGATQSDDDTNDTPDPVVGPR
jgi:hypothetical protein